MIHTALSHSVSVQHFEYIAHSVSLFCGKCILFLGGGGGRRGVAGFLTGF